MHAHHNLIGYTDSSLVRWVEGKMRHLPFTDEDIEAQKGKWLSRPLSVRKWPLGHWTFPCPCATCLGLVPSMAEACYHGRKLLLCLDQDQPRLKWASPDGHGEQESAPLTSCSNWNSQTYPLKAAQQPQSHKHLLLASKVTLRFQKNSIQSALFT